MPEFFASCPKGLVEVLDSELKELGIKTGDKAPAGVSFEGSWEDCYRVNLCSRIASRVLKPVHEFVAYQPEELYQQVLRHDFTKYIRPEQTLAVDASVKESKLRDQRFVAMKIKDAVVDQFRDKFGVRPSVDSRFPDLQINARVYKNRFILSLDTSGDPLFMRGYRKEAVEAPLKENLAAGLLRLAGWDKKSPLVDPMCGSGTILIEAAMMALNIAPGSSRKSFGFQRWNNYDPQVWDRVVQKALEAEVKDLDFRLFGYDIDRKAVMMARRNAQEAGVDHVIQFSRETVSVLKPPVEKGIIVTNPPYAVRIGDEDNVRDVYRDFSHTLKHHFKGWEAWILSGNKDLIADLKLKSTRKIFVYNGALECRFLQYKMF